MLVNLRAMLVLLTCENIWRILGYDPRAFLEASYHLDMRL
jgi:hypothetical protein